MPMFHPDIQDLISKMLVVDPTQRITLAEIKQHPAFRLHLPPDYILPTPFPLPHIEDPIDPSTIQPQLLKVMQQIGYKDDKELAEDLTCSGHTMAKVFHYMLTRQTDQTALPWEEAHHFHMTCQPEVSNIENDDNEVKELNNPEELIAPVPVNMSPGSVYSLAQKADWAIGDSVMIAYEQEDVLNSIHGSVPLIMTSVQNLMNELKYDWFHPDDWRLVARSQQLTYITFDVEIIDSDCINLYVRMNIGSEQQFKEVVEKARQALQTQNVNLDENILTDSKDEFVPDLDA
ncbi:putative CAMK family protein kinase [Tritrichomonas foetus]|uniref:CAMK family protein kinase n=1 Tax=Tritrichomonas foetus TaxID=1144522 RepID=A0A1J4KGD0_9EUKA|nr:putative CAMK family protein kinase [Tritrichomonas foetus]|eukprot:OHT08702.1 putative CAMK family protein kinase [Tritrichomonas foetus]